MEEAKEFARVLKMTLLKMHKGLNNPDFNYIIQTAPIKDEHEDYFHWHLQILPRLATPAGFELGTGMFIKKGMPKSLFRPGSSTVVLIFQKDRVRLADDITANMFYQDAESILSLGFDKSLVETDVKVRSYIGSAYEHKGSS